MDDLPRTLASDMERTQRRAMLSDPHVAPLVRYAASLRAMGLGDVPDFDPLDGGIAAKVLLLLEKPGPKAFNSGFISRNNNDQTAENTFKFLLASRLKRKDTCLWNVIPFWNGTTKVSPQELDLGMQCLAGLFGLLPDLKVIILVGRKAERALPLLAGQKYVVLTSSHPSPKVYASMRERWLGIAAEWAKALPHLRDGD